MRRVWSMVLCGVALAASSARADDQKEELAKKLANPVAALISVPFQQNVDYGIGANGDGVVYKLNVQPVIPIALNDDWNIISRTILPVVHWNRWVAPSEGTRFGLSDTTQSFFLSPSRTGIGGVIWGFGPALLLPTATEGALGSQKWGVGPTAVLLKQSGPVTAGFLAKQLWSFTTRTATSLTVNLESSYDWQNAQWTIPANFTVSQVLRLGPQLVSFQVGYRSYISAPDNGPSWGLRAAIVALFPK